MRLVPISGKKMCKILEKLGFQPIHGKGSHIRFKHADGRRTVVPVHANEDLHLGLLNAILRQVKLSKEDYDRLRQEV
jgi:predicted RNA binding protein YcfA (HicA-like mRNA interferase family)